MADTQRGREAQGPWGPFPAGCGAAARPAEGGRRRGDGGLGAVAVGGVAGAASRLGAPRPAGRGAEGPGQVRAALRGWGVPRGRPEPRSPPRHAALRGGPGYC